MVTTNCFLDHYFHFSNLFRGYAGKTIFLDKYNQVSLKYPKIGGSALEIREKTKYLSSEHFVIAGHQAGELPVC
jgi:hypothetical protein